MRNRKSIHADFAVASRWSAKLPPMIEKVVPIKPLLIKALAGICAMSLALLATGGAASADIIAAAEQQPHNRPPSNCSGCGPQANLDIALYDYSTGRQLPLPAGINTVEADEVHPSIDASGRYLVFERRTPALASSTVLMVDLRTGQQSELFSSHELSSIHPRTPTISPDGKTVLTGRDNNTSGLFASDYEVERVDVSRFPKTPYPKTIVGSGSTTPCPNSTSNPSITSHGSSAWIANEVCKDSFRGEEFLGPFTESPSNHYDGHNHASYVALDAANPGYGVVDNFNSDLFYGPGDGTRSLVRLPVDTRSFETRPGFTSDGRYLGFMRYDDAGEHLHVIDFEDGAEAAGPISTVMSPNGFDELDVMDFGNVSLAVVSGVFSPGVTVSNSGTINAEMLRPSSVGILVERIVSQHKLGRRRFFSVRPVGKHPFGPQRKGHLRLQWDLKVNGRRLPKGRYLVVLRALDKRTGRPLDLGKPTVFVVRH